MQQGQRTKLCPNCEGDVAMEVSICPYCGCNVYNKNEKLANKKINDDDVKILSYEETLASLYPPPYKPKVIDTPTSYEKEETNKEIEKEKDFKEDEKSSLIPTVLFWVGINVLVFSLILLFFSKDGFLYLKWNASFWYLYSLISFPFLYFGFKGLKNLK